MSQVHDTATAEALDALSASVDALLAAGVSPFGVDDARVLIGEVESLARRVRAVQVELVDAIDRSGVHRVDGHRSARAMVAHGANLSGPEAAR
ncbi:MAG: hypothetical protein GXY13_11990, partial [Acidimicrobiales bacterium]|nr:hypothetical protein [Acidimicrobiales bacterium]